MKKLLFILLILGNNCIASPVLDTAKVFINDTSSLIVTKISCDYAVLNKLAQSIVINNATVAVFDSSYYDFTHNYYELYIEKYNILYIVPLNSVQIILLQSNLQRVMDYMRSNL